MRPSDIISRIDKLLALATPNPENAPRVVSELIQGTVSLLTAVYGDQNERVKVLRHQLDSASSRESSQSRVPYVEIDVCTGALGNLKAELEGGLVGSIRMTLTASVLSDFLQLARQALELNNEGGTKVAAVLVAAAFEDTIRRMGELLAGVTEPLDLEAVVGKLKAAGVLTPPLLGQVSAHLNFRNKALHAEWQSIDKVSVETAWQLVQGLLLKHF